MKKYFNTEQALLAQKSILGLVTLFFLSGCRNLSYHDLMPFEFIQLKNIDNDLVCKLKEVSRKNIRQIRIYDEFQTKALIDLMRYSEDVAQVCASLKIQKYGLVKKSEKDSLLCSELEQTQDQFIFLAQVDIRDCLGIEFDKPNCPWILELLAPDGRAWLAKSIKKIEHSPMTRLLFGENYSRFKDLFKISFDLSGYKTSEAKVRSGQVTLCLRSGMGNRSVDFGPICS